MKAHWRIRELEQGDLQRLMQRHDLPEPVAALLLARGHRAGDELEEHLRASPMSLHDPFLLPDMRRAAGRAARAIRDGETILVHGDYDVDGVSGTSLLIRLLGALGARIRWHLPDRLRHGFSFGAHSIEKALEVQARLVISVDNGTSAHGPIAELAAQGIDTIVTDHHEPDAGGLPEAVAVVNPKREDSSYPWRELSGAAVAFKLAWAVGQELGGSTRVRPEIKALLEEAMAHVAIATVCDVVPLVDENRIFVRSGLRMLEATANPGLRALLGVAGLADRAPTAEDVAFQIGPRINACGRLGRADRAVELLIAQDDGRAQEIARELDELNRRRKEIESELFEAALPQAEEQAAEPVLVVAGQGWHAGVAGIVASRLVEELHKPALVIGLEGESGRGSARAEAGAELLELLRAASAHLTRFGGHARAAGCELRADAVADVRAAMCARARELGASEGAAESPLWIDYELDLAEMTPHLMRHIDRLEPFGARNEKPVLLARDLRLACPAREVGSNGGHVLLQLRKGAQVLKAMAFGMGSRLPELVMGAPIDAVYTPRWNTFRGETRLELQLVDFQVAG
jgi:single-stranded-DNA-specific exonuclease